MINMKNIILCICLLCIALLAACKPETNKQYLQRTLPNIDSEPIGSIKTIRDDDGKVNYYVSHGWKIIKCEFVRCPNGFSTVVIVKK
jgi:hypothetical protein